VRGFFHQGGDGKFNTISRRSFETITPNVAVCFSFFEGKIIPKRDGMPDAAALAGWRNERHIGNAADFIIKGADTGRINAVIIGN